MSDFTDKDYSLVSSKPVECYHFYSTGEAYFYTTHSEPVEILGIGTFIPAIMERKEYSHNAVPFDSSLNIEMDTQEDFVRLNNFRFGKPRLLMKAYRVQLSNMAYEEFYTGTVANISFTASETATIECNYFSSVFKNKVLSYIASSTCPHVLYGQYCQANKASFTFNGTIAYFGLNSSAIISAMFAGKSVIYGSLYHPISNEIRMIYDVARDALGVAIPNSAQMIRPFTNVLVGDVITLTLGCSKTAKTCQNQFDNFRNFGGHLEMPVEAPYTNAKIKRYV